MRNIVMPGARMQMIVVMKLTEPRIVPKPEKARPMIHMSAPMPGERTASFSGAYANQPKSAAPCGVRKPMIQFANPANSGVANISSMIVPCIVNAWLNCSFDMICVPGRASSARMKSAMSPPMMKKANDVTR